MLLQQQQITLKVLSENIIPSCTHLDSCGWRMSNGRYCRQQTQEKYKDTRMHTYQITH